MSHDSSVDQIAVLRALIEASASPMWAVDRDFEYLAFNKVHADRLKEMYGTEIAVGANMLDAITVPIERELIKAYVTRALTGVAHTDVRWFGQGTRLRRYREITSVPIFVDDEIVGAAMTANDRTEQALAEQQLQRLNALMDSSDDAMISWDLDGTVTSWSLGAKRLLGYSAAEILGRHIEVLLPPGSEDEFLTLRERVAQGQRITRREVTRIHKDGTAVELELTVGPIVDDFGTVVGASAIAHDITERKAMEAALRSSEAKYETAFRTSPDSVTITRLRDGIFLEVNSGFTTRTGYSAEDALGSTALELGIWSNPEERDRFIADLRASGRVDAGIAQFRHKDGSIHASALSARLMEIDGETCILTVTRDP